MYYSKYGNIIDDMKKFCKGHSIEYFCELLDYSFDNNDLWYKLLCNNSSVFKYMRKYLK